jgi:hypothetical protein
LMFTPASNMSRQHPGARFFLVLFFHLKQD